MTEFPDTISILLSLAPESEREEYARVLIALSGIRTLGENRDRWNLELLPILMDKLRAGEVKASAFGPDPGKPIKIDARAWNRLEINVGNNSTYDGDAWLNKGVSASGTELYGLHFTVGPSPQGRPHAERGAMVGKVKLEIERLDRELAPSATKADFRAKLSDVTELEIKPEWFRFAWKAAKLSPGRREPGARRK